MVCLCLPSRQELAAYVCFCLSWESGGDVGGWHVCSFSVYSRRACIFNKINIDTLDRHSVKGRRWCLVVNVPLNAWAPGNFSGTQSPMNFAQTRDKYVQKVSEVNSLDGPRVILWYFSTNSCILFACYLLYNLSRWQCIAISVYLMSTWTQNSHYLLY